jgi:hypothetical protein
MGLLSTIGGIAGGFFGGPAGAAIGSSIGGTLEEESGGGASGAARDAAAAANAAAMEDINLRRRMYEEDVARRQPFYQAGVNALPGYVSGIQEGGELVRGFNMGDYTADPGYGFRLAEGRKALTSKARARGGLVSGQTLKGMQDYAQESASNEFSNAYNRFRDTQGLRRNALAGVVGFAPTAAGSMAASGQSYATGAGPQMYQQGVNTGNALIAGQQARESSYGNLGSALSKYLNPSQAQASFSQTGFGGSGFGSGLAYGNQDLGQNF